MSLTRALSKDNTKDPDIAPPANDLALAIDVNGVPARIDTVERVQEFVGAGPVMAAYLVHFTPAGPAAATDVIRIVGHDKANGDRGEGLYFYTPTDYRK